MSETHREVPSVSRRRSLSVDELHAGVLARDIAVLPRALTLIESRNKTHQAHAEELLTRLLPRTGRSIRVGITGAPGVGKSTFVEALGMYLVGHGKSVAVLAVDPSSRISGGSILGDKTRMTRLSAEPNAYIRPSPTAGSLGGVARKTRESMLVLEAAGFDIVLIETVGVGQSETMVADMSDSFLALMLPGAGDELQGIKRGLLELVDVIAVNKADGATKLAAELAARQYTVALNSLAGREDEQAPVVLTCSALENKGVETIWQAILARHAHLKSSRLLDQRRRRQTLRWMWTLIDDAVGQAIRQQPQVRSIRDDLERDVLSGTLPAEVAARRILEAIGFDTKGDDK